MSDPRPAPKPERPSLAGSAFSPLAFLVAWVAAFSPQQVLAQGVTGRVAAEPDVSPVPGAEVILVGTRYRTFTDSLGTFVVPGVPEGRYLLQVRHPSFLTVRDSITVSSSAPGDLLVLLVPDPILMDSLRVEALTAAERRQRAAGSSHYVALGREDLARLGSQGAIWVSDLFRRDPRMTRWIRYDLTGNGILSEGICLQYPRPGPRTVRTETDGVISGCRFPATYVDDAFIPASPGLLDELPTSEVFSVELVPPSEAVYRFGRQAANGALVITTLMGAAESAANRAAVGDVRRRHWKYLGIGAGGGIFGAFGLALSQGFFSGGGVSMGGEVLPLAGVVALGVGIGEILFRVVGKDNP